MTEKAEWTPSNVYPFRPHGLILPNNRKRLTRAEVAYFKKEAKENAEKWMHHLNKRRFLAKIVTKSTCYEVMCGRKVKR